MNPIEVLEVDYPKLGVAEPGWLSITSVPNPLFWTAVVLKSENHVLNCFLGGNDSSHLPLRTWQVGKQMVCAVGQLLYCIGIVEGSLRCHPVPTKYMGFTSFTVGKDLLCAWNSVECFAVFKDGQTVLEPRIALDQFEIIALEGEFARCEGIFDRFDELSRKLINLRELPHLEFS